MNIMTIAQVINSEVLSPVSSHRPSPFALRSRLIGPLLAHDSSFLLARLRSDLLLSFHPLFALRCSFLVSNSFLGLHCDPAKALYVLFTGVNQEDMGKSAIPLLHVWIFFNLISIILLPILVATFLFSKRVTKRHPSLINVCMTWILSGIYSLLLYVVLVGGARMADGRCV